MAGRRDAGAPRRESDFFNQPVTHARLGDEMFGLRGVGLQFFAHMRDVDAQVMRLLHCLRPPASELLLLSNLLFLVSLPQFVGKIGK